MFEGILNLKMWTKLRELEIARLEIDRQLCRAGIWNPPCRAIFHLSTCCLLVFVRANSVAILCLHFFSQVYYIRKATLKTADKRYSTLNNDYEMTFSSETEVSLCDEDEDNLPPIPSVTFNFIPINQLETHAPNSTVGS